MTITLLVLHKIKHVAIATSLCQPGCTPAATTSHKVYRYSNCWSLLCQPSLFESRLAEQEQRNLPFWERG